MYATEKFKYCPVCGSKHFDTASEKSLLCDNCGFELFINPSSAAAALILNKEGELLVVRRKKEPAKGMLDLPGGFADIAETIEEVIIREVKEETGLDVKRTEYLFSQPNKYRYSGIDIPTLDMFFLCEVDDTTTLHSGDDAAECMWMRLDEIHTEQFGLRSVRRGLADFISWHKEKTRSREPSSTP